MILFVFLICAYQLIAQDSNSVKPKSYNPCEDKLFLQLQTKDSLSIDEMKIYLELKRDCEKYISDEQDSGSDSTVALGILTAFAAIFGLILLLQ